MVMVTSCYGDDSSFRIVSGPRIDNQGENTYILMMMLVFSSLSWSDDCILVGIRMAYELSGATGPLLYMEARVSRIGKYLSWGRFTTHRDTRHDTPSSLRGLAMMERFLPPDFLLPALLRPLRALFP